MNAAGAWQAVSLGVVADDLAGLSRHLTKQCRALNQHAQEPINIAQRLAGLPSLP